VRSATPIARAGLRESHVHAARDIKARATAVGKGFAGFLVQPLDADIAVGVHDRAGAARMHEGDVLADAVIGFQLEAPPVRPHRRADVLAGENVGDLVGLYRVMERRDLEAELARDIDGQRHFVGAVAVPLQQDLAVEHAREGFEFEVAVRRSGALALLVAFLKGR